MPKEAEAVAIIEERIMNKIYLIRGRKVMLDFELAYMYGVETKRLNEQVRRNIDRFPEDFMFQLTEEEYENLMSHFATSSWGGRRKMPFAFTEHGVLMLSSVLNSDTAIQVNIRIMRVYAKFREMLLTNKDILLKLEQLEGKVTGHDQDIQAVFAALKELLDPPQEPRRRIGFRRKNDED
jgi:hypothetical protein